MSEFYTFKTGDNKFQFTVKAEFLKKCENPTTVSIHDLLTVHKLNQYLHNTSGPAITRLRDNLMEYWVDGQKVSEEEGKRIEHNYKFNNKLMEEITNETPTNS